MTSPDLPTTPGTFRHNATVPVTYKDTHAHPHQKRQRQTPPVRHSARHQGTTHPIARVFSQSKPPIPSPHYDRCNSFHQSRDQIMAQRATFVQRPLTSSTQTTALAPRTAPRGWFHRPKIRVNDQSGCNTHPACFHQPGQLTNR